MLAAFAKRLARLLLFAPVQSQMIILSVLKNLFVGHKGVFELLVNREDPSKCLLHPVTTVRSDSTYLLLETLESDPFDNEASISNSKATESSLWELKALSNHWYIKVSDRAKFTHGHRPEQRVPITSEDTLKVMERRFNEENSSLSKPLSGDRFVKALEDLFVE